MATDSTKSTKAADEQLGQAHRQNDQRDGQRDDQDTPSSSLEENSPEARAQAREDARTERIERDTDSIVNTLPSPVTAVDSLGIERIITTVDGTYETAQTDPDEHEVKRLENLATRLDNKKKERLEKMGSAPNGDSGGQVAADALKAERSTGKSST